jgi:hypothetical protein
MLGALSIGGLLYNRSGFSEEENSWEPFSELRETTVLEEYLQQFPELKLLS